MGNEASDNRQRITSVEQLLAIDLSPYDKFISYANDGKDWQLERDRSVFLQTAARMKIPFEVLTERTVPFFGQALRLPPEPVAIALPLVVPEARLPKFDPVFQTVEDWTAELDVVLANYRGELISIARERVDRLVQQGRLVRFERRRKTQAKDNGVRKSRPRKRLAKADIIDEATAYELAVLRFFLKISWADLAREHLPPKGGYPTNPILKQKQIARRGNHIRMRVQPVLARLGLCRKP